jgi:hypothetical protein
VSEVCVAASDGGTSASGGSDSGIGPGSDVIDAGSSGGRDSSLDSGSGASDSGPSGGSDSGPESGSDITEAGSDGGSDSSDAGGGDAAPRDAAGEVAPSCADWQSTYGASVDGDYLIDPYPGLPSFDVYCYGMSTASPVEYIDLANTSALSSPQYNYSLFASGGACTCPDYYVVFTKIRLELSTFSVVIKDRQFAQATDGTCVSSGGVNCGHALVLPWAMAASCVGAGDTSGQANVDLTGTPFEIRAGTVFNPAGFEAAGAVNIASNGKSASITGGGYCGWFGSVPAPPDTSTFPPDTARLPLAYDDGAIPVDLLDGSTGDAPSEDASTD